MKNKLSIILLLFFFLCFGFFFVNIKEIYAQNAISLSINPPITEIMIQPGKEYKIEFNISNSGGNVLLSPKIVKFTPIDNYGNINLTNETAEKWIEYSKDKIQIQSGEEKKYYVLVSPPKGTEEKDHYLSLIFETLPYENPRTDNTAKHVVKIASNIIITISEGGEPQVSAEVVKFQAPKVIDSFITPFIEYDVILGNNGNHYWKPDGNIKINNKTLLKIAPQNIISGSTRQIYCNRENNLINCRYDKRPFIGIYSAILEFRINENGEKITKEAVTIAFPFSIFVLAVLVTTILLLTKDKKRGHS